MFFFNKLQYIVLSKDTHTHTHIHTNKIKEKLNLRVPSTHTAGKEEELHSFLISALNGWE
jgi:hypothetical protein